MKDQRRLRTWAVIFLLVSIFVGIALIPQLNHYGGESVVNAAENQFMYEKSIDVLLMLLMLIRKRHWIRLRTYTVC